ncbi:hypothetical protein GCM10010349_30130 [Streptomyces flavofungini]|uniref:CorA-like Mg2+ transporter protein n=1 Tax=Streptomyces flavofungini TaxID=68200 RepID=A0ABS0X0T3_9ACTN|nr:hypothetical protein [Streptomyces flavofungini]GHC60660.1 hypothetical protein GCM10010349_30130 [Streptomyces flavofungini]
MSGPPVGPAGARPDDLDDPGLLHRREVVLVAAVRVERSPDGAFTPGPLQRRWRVGRPNEVVSDTARRSSYTSPRLVPLLWAPDVRWHRESAGDVVSPAGFRLGAVEVIRLGAVMDTALAGMDTPAAANGVALLHGTLPAVRPAHLPKVLQFCANIDAHHRQGEQRQWVARQLPSGCRLAETEREMVHGVLVTPRRELPVLHEGLELDAPEQWLWKMLYATEYAPPSEAEEELRELRLRFPTAVRGVAGARGLSVVGTAADPNPEQPPDFQYFDASSFHLATLHSDALALACLQKAVLDAFGREVARMGESEPLRRKVGQLERDLLVFRRGYWAADFGRQAVCTAIIRNLQRGCGLPEALQSLVGDLGELARQVQAAETETTNAILGLLAAVGLPLATGLAIWQGLPQSGAPSLYRTLAVTCVTTVLLMSAFPGLRRLFVTLFRSRAGRGSRTGRRGRIGRGGRP